MTDTILAPVAALTLRDTAALTGRAQRALEFIESFEISDHDTFELALHALCAIKERAAYVASFGTERMKELLP